MKIPQVKFDLFYYLFFVVKHGSIKFLARLKQNHRLLQQTIFTLESLIYALTVHVNCLLNGRLTRNFKHYLFRFEIVNP